MKYWKTALSILALSASHALAEDFKTIKGKEYKNATVSRVEPDGIVIKTKAGISKVYFIELPKDVQERFLPSPAKTVAAQREREPIKLKGWAEAVANPTSFIIFFVAGTIIIAGVVFAIVRKSACREEVNCPSFNEQIEIPRTTAPPPPPPVPATPNTITRSCPDCGREVSPSARACPHCGRPFEKPGESGAKAVFGVLGGIILGIIAIMAMGRCAG